MIKGKPPVPFQTIALGISFSPGLPSLISEMRRLRLIHNSLAVFVHVGKKTGDKSRELAELLTFHGFNDFNSRIYWENGDEVTNILRICKHEVVDLLLIGASDKLNFAMPAGKIAVNIFIDGIDGMNKGKIEQELRYRNDKQVRPPYQS